MSEATTSELSPADTKTSWRRWVTTYPIIAFLVPTYVFQTVLALMHHYEIRNYGAGVLRPFAPAFFAFVVAWIADGKPTAMKYLKSFTLYRQPWYYYAFALLYPSAVGAVSLVILRIIGLNTHIELDWESVETFEFFFLQVRVAASEELAWVSFMVAVLATRYRLFQASMFVGFAWGVWYIPLVLTVIQVAPGFPIGPLIINFMCIASICAWLYARTKSALLVFIMQFTTAYTGQIVPVLPLRGGDLQYEAFVVCKCVFAVALYVFWGPKPLFGAAKAAHDDR